EARAERDLPLRRLWTIADLTLATLRGIVRHHLLTDPRGFDAIDDYDCREWLRMNGASDPSLDSGYLRGLYDLGFSYEDGDPARPRIAAGQALRSMARAFFTYRGSFFWRMQAGMGDVVFAPLYEDRPRRRRLRRRRPRRRPRCHPPRLQGDRRPRPPLARHGRAREDGRDAGVPDLDERGHGGAGLEPAGGEPLGVRRALRHLGRH